MGKKSVNFIQNNLEFNEVIEKMNIIQEDKKLNEIKFLSTGESFGELAIFGKIIKSRSATIICRKDTHFAILERAYFQKILSFFIFVFFVCLLIF